jgi:hypothetical protein
MTASNGGFAIGRASDVTPAHATRNPRVTCASVRSKVSASRRIFALTELRAEEGGVCLDR